ncbi:MAG: cysteine peptidase family C39 domain-containing protein [Nitrospira sp.]|nr:cysteine peptidase family C39 domain-containing protein [Nitrospira sp.]
MFTQSGQALSSSISLRAAKHVGLKAGVVQTKWDKLSGMPLPAMAKLVDGRYLVVAKVQGEKVLVQHGDETGRSCCLVSGSEMIWTGSTALHQAGQYPATRPQI